MDLHPEVAPLAGLLGTFEGTGHGHYPTISDFAYIERVTFAHVGKPMLSYTQATKSSDGRPMHSESGYLRAIGDGAVEFALAQPTGHVELGTGTLRNEGDELIVELNSEVHGTPTAKQVQTTRRVFRLQGDTLRYTFAMAAVGEAETEHLVGELIRVESS